MAKVAKVGERTHGRKAVARKEAKGKREVAREKPEQVGRVARQDTLQHGAGKEAATNCAPSVKTTVKTSNNQLTTKKICKHGVYQWQEVISRRDKRRAKKAKQASLLSVESSHNSSLRKIVDVKDRWVKVRAAMDSGAAGHVMLQAMFPRVKLERKTSPKKFVAANVEQIGERSEKNIPFKANE